MSESSGDNEQRIPLRSLTMRGVGDGESSETIAAGKFQVVYKQIIFNN